MRLHLKNHNSRPYGTAYCVNCEADIDLSGKLNKIEVQCGNEKLYFCICDTCQLHHVGRQQHKKIVRKAVKKIRVINSENSCLAVLSHVALLQNNYDPVAAFEIGQTLPFHLYDSILQGRTNLTNICGMVLIVTGEA